MSARINHAACLHPSTKVARAKCRRDLAKMVTTILAVATVAADAPNITAWNTMKSGPLELTAAPIAATVVTRDTWREYKGELVSLSVADGDTMNVMITGWSENLIQYKVEGAGKLVRLPAGRIESVIA